MLFQISLSIFFDLFKSNLDEVFDFTPYEKAKGINTDSRSIAKGEVFLALRGRNFDGHKFAEDAIAKGAVALIVDHYLPVNLSKKIPQFKVKDTLVAYQQIAHWWRNQVDIPVIAVTGSVGKTTTKELIAAVLKTQGKVHKTQSNYNNEIGVPKTLLELTTDQNYMVIEMGMRALGEIALLTQIARPTIGLITNVGTAHIGLLGSKEAIAQAKCELLAQMPQEGIAILNHDNTLLIQTAKKVWSGKTITYGLEGGDITGKLIDSQTLQVEGINFPLPLPGRHNALNYLGALAVAKCLNFDWTPLTQGVEVHLPEGRSRQYQLSGDIIILDETYNAGLESMKAALNLLKEIPGKRHLAILGTMKELGEKSAQSHYEVGKMVKKVGVDHLLVLVNDPEAEVIIQGALGVITDCISTHQELIERLKEIVKPGDRLLFKASNSVGLNLVVEKFREQLKV
ncbi:UDP-N-acetylmuramoyl-tripeptide--D-alanyl-D-alanine ligase [cyanobacterium endosymbiont of Epithemia clementina EcSB]|uniref:UDP-N-acetylmuramoyl-tripeptide--D-alanyl-D- alanine ligase n=1 Tax=cyanobacterium endosymbiont of Epithemia clementina EcSB TaxID=3034674 RepID=UPI00247FCAEF|nr:UDP-N-acetylmuramoyl-tripeptide--D-alanyl-D-alanine ligase [cyanobacterium endosymbiont of Epithemia clementina EcSB]WGT67742.1 UDP-N-acetylmuramoyl-tripeptide--D-alanyl-D-alanine ligase [cyanobacterium endosymbiont of Epithemia clementina EcSB]